MHVETTQTDATQIEADALVLAVADAGEQSTVVQQIDQATGNALSQLKEHGEFSGKRGELLSVYLPNGIQAKQLVLVGLGERDSMDAAVIYQAASSASRKLASKARQRVAFAFPEQDLATAVCGAMVGCHGQDLYRSEKNTHPIEDMVWLTSDHSTIELGKIWGESVNLTRRLVNQPASEIYPESFEAVCRQVASECDLEVEVWDENRLNVEACGALLAVARGSNRPPRLVILRHQGGPDDQAPIALVGKGVTFDSGGLSLKPSDSMKDMKCDMAGAATVVGAMQAIAKMKLPVNVMGLVGLVENMVSGDSYKLGDVLTARNGKTIEVLNTDAEGRLVLADVLDVAVTGGADQLIDLATLTGACLVALGTNVAGVMTNDQGWCDEVLAAASRCAEPAWQLPMFDEFAEQIKSDVADIKNIGNGRWGGAITAAKFLEEFVSDKPWVHIDIAGPAFAEGSKAWIDGGASGAFVRTLIEVIQRRASGT